MNQEFKNNDIDVSDESPTGAAANTEPLIDVSTPEKVQKLMFPDEIAGVKRGEPMTKEMAGGKNINPNYYSDDIGYKTNCTSCVLVHKARELGYNLEALPARSDDSGIVKVLRKHIEYGFKSPDGTKMTGRKIYRVNNQQECAKLLNNSIKPGECYTLEYHPPQTENGFGHVVEVYKDINNKLEFFDSQNGKIYGEEFINNIEYNSYKNDQIYYYPLILFRIDDKILNFELLDKVSRPARHKP